MRLALRITLPITALAVLALAAPSGASALTCGQTVTHNIKLTADLDCSPSLTPGLVVGKSGITINLNHHTITGPGPTGHRTGIDNEAGYNNVTLENGTVTQYYYDVYFEYTTGSKILHVRAAYSGVPGSDVGFYFEYSQNGLIKNAVASNSDYGYYLNENSNVNLSKSKSVNAIAGLTYGVLDEESRSSIDHVTANGGYDGILVEYPYIGYTLTDNTTNGNSNVGIYVYENYPTALYQAKVVGNVANNNDYGLYADVNTLGKKNRAHGNMTQNCFHVPCVG